MINARPGLAADSRLQRLLALRGVLLVTQLVGIGIAFVWLRDALPWEWIGAVAVAYAVLTLATAWRLSQQRAASDAEFFAHLLADVVLLTAMLALTGAASNPFVSLYLLPLVIAATTLPARFAWAMTIATGACYAALFLLRPSETHVQHDPQQGAFALHLTGMWVNFLLSAVIISYFVVRLAQDVRRRDAAIARQKEQALRDERIVALGALAAGAAHELGTPLSTMAVVLKELEHEHSTDPQLAGDLATLRAQVAACKHTITRMVNAAGHARAEGGNSLPIDRFLRETVERWRLMRPAVHVDEKLEGPQPAPPILAEQTLSQAIVSLLNNAADASPQDVELEARWDALALTLEIRDRGQGFAPEVRGRAGQVFYTTKAEGTGAGIGLFLAKATIERLGGHVTLSDRPSGGVCTRVDLPLGVLGGAVG